MKDEIFQKIRDILVGPTINESQVSHLFTLVRKLLERLPKAERRQFPLLAFYCDWILHAEIDRSEQGAAILEKIHHIVIDHMGRSDNASMAGELSASLSLDLLGDQLNEFLQRHAGGQKISSSDWLGLVPLIVEIVSSCPVTISAGRGGTLRQIRNQILSEPIKGQDVVKEVAIVKCAAELFYTSQPADRFIYCVQVTLTSTTKIVAPLTR